MNAPLFLPRESNTPAPSASRGRAAEPVGVRSGPEFEPKKTDQNNFSKYLKEPASKKDGEPKSALKPPVSDSRRQVVDGPKGVKDAKVEQTVVPRDQVVQTSPESSEETQAPKKASKPLLKKLSSALGDQQDLMEQVPLLAILNGQLQRVEPKAIPSAILETPFVQEMMSGVESSSLQELWNQPQSLGSLLQGFRLEGQLQQNLGALGLSSQDFVAPKELFDVMGFDSERMFSELTMLQENLRFRGLGPYMVRAAALRAQMGSHQGVVNQAQEVLQGERQTVSQNRVQGALLAVEGGVPESQPQPRSLSQNDRIQGMGVEGSTKAMSMAPRDISSKNQAPGKMFPTDTLVGEKIPDHQRKILVSSEVPGTSAHPEGGKSIVDKTLLSKKVDSTGGEPQPTANKVSDKSPLATVRHIKPSDLDPYDSLGGQIRNQIFRQQLQEQMMPQADSLAEVDPVSPNIQASKEPALGAETSVSRLGQLLNPMDSAPSEDLSKAYPKNNLSLGVQPQIPELMEGVSHNEGLRNDLLPDELPERDRSQIKYQGLTEIALRTDGGVNVSSAEELQDAMTPKVLANPKTDGAGVWQKPIPIPAQGLSAFSSIQNDPAVMAGQKTQMVDMLNPRFLRNEGASDLSPWPPLARDSAGALLSNRVGAFQNGEQTGFTRSLTGHLGGNFSGNLSGGSDQSPHGFGDQGFSQSQGRSSNQAGFRDSRQEWMNLQIGDSSSSSSAGQASGTISLQTPSLHHPLNPLHANQTNSALSMDHQGPLNLEDVMREGLGSRILQKAQMKLREGGGSFRIQGFEVGMSPQDSLDLAVKLDGGKVDLRILAGSDRLKDAIYGDMTQLREALSRQDLELSDVEVAADHRDGEGQQDGHKGAGSFHGSFDNNHGAHQGLAGGQQRLISELMELNQGLQSLWNSGTKGSERPNLANPHVKGSQNLRTAMANAYLSTHGITNRGSHELGSLQLFA